MMRTVADGSGQILEPERYHNLPYAPWFLIRDPTTGLVVEYDDEWAVIATTIPGVAPYLINFEEWRAKPLVRH